MTMGGFKQIILTDFKLRTKYIKWIAYINLFYLYY